MLTLDLSRFGVDGIDSDVVSTASLEAGIDSAVIGIDSAVVSVASTVDVDVGSSTRMTSRSQFFPVRLPVARVEPSGRDIKSCLPLKLAEIFRSDILMPLSRFMPISGMYITFSKRMRLPFGFFGVDGSSTMMLTSPIVVTVAFDVMAMCTIRSSFLAVPGIK